MKRAISIILLLAIFATSAAFADENEYFILCNPDSHVCIRRSPKKDSDEIGQLEFGDMILTDGRKRNGFLHCIRLSNEWGEGWVYKGYLVQDEPRKWGQLVSVTANGRVASRRYVNGKRQGWLKRGQKVTVYGYSDEWAVTNRGFVKTKFLEVGNGE